jgi:hypothetical protein
MQQGATPIMSITRCHMQGNWHAKMISLNGSSAGWPAMNSDSFIKLQFQLNFLVAAAQRWQPICQIFSYDMMLLHLI